MYGVWVGGWMFGGKYSGRELIYLRPINLAITFLVIGLRMFGMNRPFRRQVLSKITFEYRFASAVREVHHTNKSKHITPYIVLIKVL